MLTMLTTIIKPQAAQIKGRRACVVRVSATHMTRTTACCGYRHWRRQLSCG